MSLIHTNAFTMFLFTFIEAEPINTNAKSYTLPYELDLCLVLILQKGKIIGVNENFLNFLNGLEKLI